MYLSELKLWNFRKYGTKGGPFETSLPGLIVNFHPGVNVLIGENDSGKTAIVDAIRYTLRTQSGEFIQFDEKDFYQDELGNRSDQFKIECTFDGLSKQDCGLFWEWIDKPQKDKGYTLNVWLYAKMKNNEIHPQFSAGFADDGIPMESEARNLLRVVYLKPLRDALTDMTHGYKSRLAQILGAHTLFHEQKDEQGHRKPHELENSYKSLKKSVDDYFKEGGNGQEITEGINEFLHNHFLIQGDARSAEIKLTGGELSEILRQLDLILEGNKSGLGTLNLLCISAELLLMKQQTKGLKLALVEELEAHLHPQYQLRLIDYITSNADNEQFILTTHSITLASKLKIENIIVLHGNDAYPLSPDCTKMSKSDYMFLERFLDATKANLFFAKGVIMVEGDAENLLLPAIAKCIGKPLHQYGVSIVNVGSTAYKRYVSLFRRRDQKTMQTKVAIVTDMDVRAKEYYDDGHSCRLWKISEIQADLDNITQDVDYSKFPSYISSKEELEQLVRTNWKGCSDHPKGDTIKNLRAILTDDNVTSAPSQEVLQYLRTKKRDKLKAENEEGNIKIFIPQDWTLEYDIARSKLYRLLYLSIRLANEPIDGVNIGEEIENMLNEYPQDHEPTLQESYKIFKPLNDGTVSKAITAQYMASFISGELNCDKLITNEEIKDAFLTDDHLSYLREAIKHVTQQ